MSKTDLEKYIEDGFSTWDIADLCKTSQSNVRYWLKKFGLHTQPKFKYLEDSKLCLRCNTIKSVDEFYKKRSIDYPNYTLSYCIPCTKNQAIERQRALKKQAIDYKGGKCSGCGYNRCQAALEFHHINPEEKDYSISHSKMTNLDGIKTELDKCVLLCRNCHAEKHFNMGL